jgi:hypothetical protein
MMTAASPTRPATAPGPVIAASVLLYLCAGVSVVGTLGLAAGGALGDSLSDVPFAGVYTTKLQVVGFGGAFAMFVLAIADIVLGVGLTRGAPRARTATVLLSIVVGLVSLASPLGPLCLVMAALVIGLVMGPRSARRHFQRLSVEVV